MLRGVSFVKRARRVDSVGLAIFLLVGFVELGSFLGLDRVFAQIAQHGAFLCLRDPYLARIAV